MFEWIKIKRMLRKHPGLLDSVFKINEKEAREYALSMGYKSFHDVMEQIKCETNFPDSFWKTAEPHIQRSKRKAFVRRLWRNAVGFFSARRRLSIAFMLLLLLTGFFTLVPAGRAMANGIFNYVIKIVDSRMIFDSGSFTYGPQTHIPQLSPDTTPQLYDSSTAPSNEEIDEARMQFYNYTNERPVIASGDWIRVKEIKAEEFGPGFMIITTYEDTRSNSDFFITETWYENPEATRYVSADDPVYFTRSILDDVQANCMYDEQDKDFIAVVFIGNSEITLFARNPMDTDELLDSLCIYEGTLR